MKIYRCNVCGNILLKIKDSGVNPSCCGQNMELLRVQTSDGALEKHVPIVEIEPKRVCVKVGSAAHPMVENHYIEWILLETDEGYQLKYLKPGMEPRVKFKIRKDEQVIAVYAYCNIHGLYQATL
ncbi:MAG: desulfoferrodoxin [Firmicutes bacterium]|nr:desulfoferrodoxin [Bacillota bacterium]